jgi:serine/threonine-protein kinase
MTAMTPERWAAIERIYALALERPPAERSGLLDRECRQDPALRAEVESLLAEHDREPAFLDTPPWVTTGSAQPDDVIDRIGSYRIVRVLGRGGMGTVYLADREATDFRQQVALKVMRRGLDTDDLIARFRAERQILATLDHPNIARLIDVGATPQGLPYFVMEFVDGKPILEFCNDHRLDLTQRIQLFRRICEAVHHAHRSLIVHRDLKPGNILVSADGVPKLLDFGIAKMLDPASELARLRTQTDVRLLTPDYAAPEQIRGDAVTTACDVYALGILLYELLAGCHPHGGDGASRAEMERRILEHEPKPPSTVISDAAAFARRSAAAPLRRRLHGDLDTVVLKALRKEPEQRYASVLSLAEDLDRHLTGLPVHARPATARYRIRKFIARNRLSVSAAALLALMLMGATSITLYQSSRIRQESARALRERDKAFEVRNFLLEMFGTTGPDQATGDTVTARQLLDRRAATLDDSYSGDDETRAEMMYVLAEGYEKLGLIAQAEPLARASLDIRRRLFGEFHEDVVASLNLVGWLLHQKDRIEEAERYLREAVSTGRQVFGNQGGFQLARALNDLGVVREARDDLAEAANLYRQSLAMRRRSARLENVGVAVTMSNLSAVLYRQRHLDSATVMADSSLQLFRRLLGDDHQRTTIVQANLAAFQSAKGDFDGAARQYREILERRRRVFGPNHNSIPATLVRLAAVLVNAGRYDEAEPLLAEALDLLRAAGASERDRAAAFRSRGDIYSATQRVALAIDDYRAALDLNRRIFGEANEAVIFLSGRIAWLSESLGRSADAESALRETARLTILVHGDRHPRAAEIRVRFMEFLQRQRRNDDLRAEWMRFEPGLDPSLLARDTALARRVAAVRSAAGG